MTELDEFVQWIMSRKKSGDMIDGVGYGALTGAIDMFRAERLTGRRYSRWIDASEALHPERVVERLDRPGNRAAGR